VTRDEQILCAAEKLFFERSFDGVGVDEIGRVAGTSGSAIYRHFPSKDAILAALFDKTLDTLLVRVGEPEQDPHADLEKLLRSFASLTNSHNRLVSIWLRGRWPSAIAGNTAVAGAESPNAGSAVCNGAIPGDRRTSSPQRPEACSCSCYPRRCVHPADGERSMPRNCSCRWGCRLWRRWSSPPCLFSDTGLAQSGVERVSRPLGFGVRLAAPS
jgi:hypothetical protein